MMFRNFCIVIMGRTDGIFDEISKISEKILGKMNAKGIMIITFSSVADVKELRDFFKSYDRNFLLFDLDEEFSAYNFLKKDVSFELFGKLPNIYSMTDKLHSELNIITADTENVRWENKEKTTEELLAEAIKNEDYEMAAKLRDRLQKK